MSVINTLRRQDIGRKVAAAMTVMCLMLLLQGFIALHGIHRVTAGARNVTEQGLPRLVRIDNLSTLFEQCRALPAVLLSAAPDDQAAILTRERGARARIDTLIKQIRQDAEPGTETLTQQLSYSWTAYLRAATNFDKTFNKDRAVALVTFKTGLTHQADIVRDSVLAIRRGQVESTQNGAADAESAGRSVSSLMMATSILTMLLALGVGCFMIVGVSRPLARISRIMQRLSDHDLAVDIPFAQRRDEIGRMAATTRTFRDSMIETERLAVEKEERQRASTRHAEALAALVFEFEREAGSMSQQLAQASGALETSARTMSDTAARTDTQASDVAEAARQASATLDSVACASEQLAASINEIGSQVARSAQRTADVVSDARRTDATVRGLAEAAQRVGQVVDLIAGVASQTNLLALNATIEAARAGEAGRGFAVVASEVKSLANQTTRATDEIANQITEIRRETGEAVSAIQGISGMIDGLSEIATSLAAAVEQQGAATAEIARNVQQTARSTGNVTTHIAGVSQAANDTGSVAGEVLASASGLAQQAERLSAQVRIFVDGIRAA